MIFTASRACLAGCLGFALLALCGISPAAAVPADWQQRVNYEMDLTLVDSQRSMTGTATVTYINNSPDTLGTIWFRLAPAALRGGSVVDTTMMRGRIHRFSDVDSSHWADCRVHGASSTDRQVDFVQDHSVGRLIVDPPLLPGDSVRAAIEFTTRFPTGPAQFRIGYTRGQYKGAYWYPQVCAYTPEYGWTVNRYFGTGEAYGEIGDYTLRFTVPYKYIIASTGELVNMDEVLPPERLEGLSIDNPEPIPVPTGEEGERPVTWVFQANEVPDVAFTMDSMYLIDRIVYDDFESWAFIRRDQTDDWSDAAEICGWTIEELKKIYGGYPWPRVKASYSWSAMEYPMLTMMSWRSPLYAYVMMHEVIHNYNPMILQSNSVDEQWIDEGFTAFIEHELSAKWAGTRWDRERTYVDGLFERTFWERDDVVRGKRPYLEAVLPGEDLPMVRAGDTADDYPLLRASSYYKTPVLLNALRGMLGEDAFWRGFRLLYERHKLTHVGHDDIITSFEDASGWALKNTFEQFLYGSGDIDYSLTRFDTERRDSGRRVTIGVKRIGEIKLPLRLALISETGDTLRGEIPFLTTDPPLPGYERWGTWDQWHMPNREYRFHVDLPADQVPVRAILDPDGHYLDRNPLDDQSGLPPMEFGFDPVLWPVEPPPVDRYRVLLSPAAGFDLHTGPLLGVSLRGSYMEREALVLGDLLVAPAEPDGISTRWGRHRNDRIQGRLGIAHPLNRDFGPWYGTVYGGVIHDDTFAESGLWRSWRAWSTWFDRATVMLRGGFWRREGVGVVYPGDIGPLGDPLQATSWRNDLLDVYYTHGRYDVEGALGRWPYEASARFTAGLNDAFSMLDVEGTTGKRWFGAVHFGVEVRGAVLNHRPPERFASTLRGGAPYRTLGQPLASGVWEKSWRSREPAVLAPAAFASPLGDVDTDRFLGVRLTQTVSIPGADKPNPVSRFLSHLNFGLYEGGAVYRDIGSSNSDKLSYGLELGLEMNVIDLYGLDFSMRLPSTWTVESTNNTHRLGERKGPGNDGDVAFWINIDLDRYFRN